MAGNSDTEFPTIIGSDAVFKGELKFEKGVKHLGRFEGQIETKGCVVVAEGAELKGEITAGNVEIQGDVKGNLTASGKVCLAATAKLEGDLRTARLEVVEGAVFIGRCCVGTNGGTKPGDAGLPRPPARDKAAVPIPGGGKKSLNA